ncbi:MAG: hypothetical protein ABSG25_06365, partial [Bryobacteraceae bacterium]
MKVTVNVTVLALLAAAAAFPQTGQQRAKRVIDDALAALGGNRFLAMQDVVERGRAYSFHREQLSGLTVATLYIRYLPHAEPAETGGLRIAEREAFGKSGRDGVVLFLDGKEFEITFRGARPLPRERVERDRETTLHNVFYILRERLSEPGITFDYRGFETVDNHPTDAVDIGDADNRTVTVYFDRESKLPIRQVYYWLDPKTRDRNEEVTVFAKFR